MADYTYQELMQMQTDAIKRVEAMQKRARSTAGLDTASPETKKSPEKGDVKDVPKHVPMPEGYLKGNTHNEGPRSVSKGDRAQAFNLRLGGNDIEIDSDKALLLSLIILLAEEGADELLLAALVYMLG
ncbi:MAG: hypothetical protein J6Q83_00890 [Clostridia bacterium]|nr:hypothetical protein [Clostridia bacterium]